MAWPPNALPVSRTDQTPQLANHPLDHNDVNQAVNDIVAKLLTLDVIQHQFTQITSNYTVLDGVAQYVSGSYQVWAAKSHARKALCFLRGSTSWTAGAPIGASTTLGLYARLSGATDFTQAGASLLLPSVDAAAAHFVEGMILIPVVVPANVQAEFRIYAAKSTLANSQIQQPRTTLDVVTIPS